MSEEQNNSPKGTEVKPRGFSSKRSIIIIIIAAVLALGIGCTEVDNDTISGFAVQSFNIYT